MGNPDEALASYQRAAHVLRSDTDRPEVARGERDDHLTRNAVELPRSRRHSASHHGIAQPLQRRLGDALRGRRHLAEPERDPERVELLIPESRGFTDREKARVRRIAEHGHLPEVRNDTRVRGRAARDGEHERRDRSVRPLHHREYTATRHTNVFAMERRSRP